MELYSVIVEYVTKVSSAILFGIVGLLLLILVRAVVNLFIGSMATSTLGGEKDENKNKYSKKTRLDLLVMLGAVLSMVLGYTIISTGYFDNTTLKEKALEILPKDKKEYTLAVEEIKVSDVGDVLIDELTITRFMAASEYILINYGEYRINEELTDSYTLEEIENGVGEGIVACDIYENCSLYPADTDLETVMISMSSAKHKVSNNEVVKLNYTALAD